MIKLLVHLNMILISYILYGLVKKGWKHTKKLLRYILLLAAKKLGA